MLTSLYLPVVNEDCGGVETSKLVVDEVLIEEWQFLVVSQYTGVDHFTSQNTTLFHKEVNSVLPLPNVCWLLVSDSCNGEKMGRKWTSFGNIVFLQFQLNESPYVYRVQSKPTPVGFIFEKSTQHLAGWANRWRTWGSKMKGLTGEASVPSRKLTYPTWGSWENHLQICLMTCWFPGGYWNWFLRSSWSVMITSWEKDGKRQLALILDRCWIWVDYNPPTECVANIKILPGYIYRFCWEKTCPICLFFDILCG